ncbi:LacI family DNA-binding transcriptional regulator [Streptomyces sp. ACA25]|uniref:LacI family DNA-binding transcriptional regulator n=1 Tax=Streptomyces sp. ACA25 TaxID=3022596 RepID=UPI002307CB44|nr:LacI family DNA-binding transcriptional regulator [Streptomyces sp. ACA25]MDB1089294.1 LacI family DNA-binding transcriptional regulator [Streptomyces sp. ACA25]
MAQTVGIKEVARQAGVSVGTVSNVINRPHMVAEETRLRVQTAIVALGYVRSESARQLRAGQSRIIALLVLDMANPFFVEVATGAERVARAADLGVMLCNSAQSASEEAAYLSLFAEQRVRGVLVTPADMSGRNLTDFRRHHIPFVFVDRVLPSAEGCSVSVDDVLGGTLAVRHLTEQGHTDVAYVSGPLSLQQCQDRRDGALAALAEAGLPAAALRVVEAGRLDVAAGRAAGARLLEMAPRPSAVFCANDLLALGVLQALFAAGVRVPEEVALVGYDDIEFAAAAAVPLTSVRQPAARMGRQAAELLMEETGEAADRHRHQRIVLEPELVVRESSLLPRAPAAAARPGEASTAVNAPEPVGGVRPAGGSGSGRMEG